MRKFLTSPYIVFIIAAIWLSERYIIGIFTHFNASEGSKWGVLTHLFWILVCILIAMIRSHQNRQYGFVQLFKIAAKYGVLYAVVGTAMVVVYYNWISNEMVLKQQQDIATIIQSIDSPEEYKAIVKDNPVLAKLSADQIKEKAIERTLLFTKTSSMASLGGVALIIVAMVYSLIAGWMFNMFLFKERK
jgi:hypothetical protein